MKRKKILIPLLVVLVAGVAAKFVLAKPPPEVHHKVDGVVYVLPKEFLLNLSDGRYAKLNVALVLDHSQPTAAVAGGHGAAAAPPEGFGTLEQEAVVRDIVTDVVTGTSGDELVSERGRRAIKEEILRELRAHSDVRVHEILLPDVAVQ
ncbi:MAG TPA: flagellar basal body-associated FliL family protein [Conexibacter sp.]|nr:flagellar basal body-associated FliL family protein [Conexibacter sp.]